MNWVDFFILVLLVVAFANGYRRGAFKEISTFLGMVLTTMVAIYYAGWLATKAAGRLNFSPSLIYLFSFILVFLLFQIFLRILGHYYYKMVKITPLKKYDRIIGGGFGLFKGAIALSLIFLLFIFFPSFQSFNRSIDESSMAPVFRKFVPVGFDLGMQLHPTKAKFIDKVKTGILGSKAEQYEQNPEALVENNELPGISYNDVNVLRSVEKYFGRPTELAKRVE